MSVSRGTAGSVPPVPRVRLDTLLAERGLFPSRTRAAAAVMAGEVRLGPGDARAAKPGQLVEPDVELGVDAPPPYVSRGGIKLRNALDALGLDPGGPALPRRRRLDRRLHRLPAAGGRRARVALDVAYGELDWRCASDERVTVIERANARALEPERAALRARPGRDRRLLHLAAQGAAGRARCAAARFDALAMVKPQFEVGTRAVGAAGWCATPEARRDAAGAVAGARARSAPRCWASPPRACPGRGQPRDVRVAGRGRARGRVVDVGPRSRRSRHEGVGIDPPRRDGRRREARAS